MLAWLRSQSRWAPARCPRITKSSSRPPINGTTAKARSNSSAFGMGSWRAEKFGLTGGVDSGALRAARSGAASAHCRATDQAPASDGGDRWASRAHCRLGHDVRAVQVLFRRGAGWRRCPDSRRGTNVALKEALDAGEEYTQARLGGNHGSLTTGNWAAACFLHDTARPVDGQAPNPHLHSHVVVFNMTHAGDKVRSVQAAEWYRIQSYMSAIYQASMANQALAGGYQLEHGKNFSTRIKGFSDEYLEAISARTKEIEAEKEAKGLSGAEADERINKRLRQSKQTMGFGGVASGTQAPGRHSLGRIRRRLSRKRAQRPVLARLGSRAPGTRGARPSITRGNGSRNRKP